MTRMGESSMPGGAVSISVSELNEYARKLLAGDPLLRNVEVTGEISGYKHHYSGHRYFSLKDENARVQCVMFRQQAMGLDFKPADGMRVTVRAAASIFARDGSFQLYVNAMRQAGQGDLFLRFEQLRQKLMAEGLFDPARKRPIPFLPKTIGLVTSETGAAVRDMIRVARRRNPNVGIVVSPCAVQGTGAAEEIARAIARLNDANACDVILVGRGGGSIEDLWAFNEEVVARAIAASRIPTISCVGHEVDFTIADFVADVRAATPSAAAELAVPVLSQLAASLDDCTLRLTGALQRGQAMRRLQFERLCGSETFKNPKRLLIEQRRTALTELVRRCDLAETKTVDGLRRRLGELDASLRALNPEAVLDRGYAIVTNARGAVTRVGGVQTNEEIAIRLSDGTLSARVDAIQPKYEESL